MKTAALLLLLSLISLPTLSHEGGHGPATEGVGKYGGPLSAVINKADLKTVSDQTPIIYKAELIRSADLTVRLYLYNKKDELLNLSSFEPKASAFVETKNEKLPFPLTVSKNHFIGKAPKSKRKPFNIEIVLIENGKELFVAFENLD